MNFVHTCLEKTLWRMYCICSTLFNCNIQNVVFEIVFFWHNAAYYSIDVVDIWCCVKPFLGVDAELHISFNNRRAVSWQKAYSSISNWYRVPLGSHVICWDIVTLLWFWGQRSLWSVLLWESAVTMINANEVIDWSKLWTAGCVAWACEWRCSPPSAV